MNKEDKKNLIIKALTNIYEWCKGKGWNETIIKVVLGIIFGVACVFILNGCSIGYKSASQELNINVLPVEEWTK